MENKTIKNKNLYMDDYISDDDYNEFENNNEYENENENYQKLINTTETIQKELFDYVEKKCIPLCEYLSVDNIQMFITK